MEGIYFNKQLTPKPISNYWTTEPCDKGFLLLAFSRYSFLKSCPRSRLIANAIWKLNGLRYNIGSISGPNKHLPVQEGTSCPALRNVLSNGFQLWTSGSFQTQSGLAPSLQVLSEALELGACSAWLNLNTRPTREVTQTLFPSRGCTRLNRQPFLRASHVRNRSHQHWDSIPCPILLCPFFSL